jgi:hypothetical protein
MAEDSEPEVVTGGSPQAATEKATLADDRDAEIQEDGDESAPELTDQTVDHATPQRYWWQRPTVRALKREHENYRDYRGQWDERDNTATRLPAEESVHLGGLALAEAFSPSTISALYDTLRRWPGRDDRQRDEWIAELDRSRGGGGWGGWTNLGVVRPPGEFVMIDGYCDSELPNSVTAVWLHLHFLMPSLAVVVATFTFRDEVADVSSLLRRDYQTHERDVRIHVYGKFGWLRARLPWSRPKRHGMTASISRAEDEKRRAFENIVQEREAECSRWFTSRFRGRFALADSTARPIARFIFTEQEVPFKNRDAWFRPIGLTWSPTIYRSVEIPGWALTESQWPYMQGRFVLTFAARRRDAAREPTKGESVEDNWYLTQRFSDEQASLVARYAVHALLALYGDCLAKLRDAARGRRHLKHPVRDARALNDYLTTDGLDAATVTSDVGVLTNDLRGFRWEIPEYTEDRDSLPDAFKRDSPLEFVPGLCSMLKEQAARLASDTANTAGNIRASAELTQAIANTRLQRTVVIVSLAALIVAVVGVFLAA